MPLTVTQPSKELFYPLIERVERRLDAWKGKFISKGGRTQLVESVLLTVPRWVIKRQEKIMRDFLWEDTVSNTKKVHLVN
jgi:hypothetical protein